MKLGREALDAMGSYAWPGNVRELEHVIERAVLLGNQPEIGVSDLPKAMLAPAPQVAEFTGPVIALAEIERRYAAWALEQMEGRKMATAEKLDVDRKTLAKLLGDPPDRAKP